MEFVCFSFRESLLFICPIAIAQHGTDYKITPVISVCMSVCLCVFLTALSRSQFLTDFDEIWHRHQEPDTKEPFRWGQYPIRVSPILPNFPLNWHLHNAFSMGVLKHFAGVVSEPIVAVNSSNDVTWPPPTPECQKRVKGRGRGQGHVTP